MQTNIKISSDLGELMEQVLLNAHKGLDKQNYDKGRAHQLFLQQQHQDQPGSAIVHLTTNINLHDISIHIPTFSTNTNNQG